MNQELFASVDEYFQGLFIPPDPALDGALQASVAADLPAIQVAPTQGKLLHLLARMAGARRILEIGTLGGYSTIWLARALPQGGQLISLELDPHHAEVARANLERAGLAQRAEVRVGPARESLEQLQREGSGPFDLVFIDADKPSYPEYLDWSLRLTRLGGVIIADNVVRGGEVLDARSESEAIRGLRRFNSVLASDPRVSATALQMVGLKGYDGMVIAMVTGGAAA
ncbi:MAG TPA: O-methyltransferase [Roseiflexaceae bacterium]|nr:O-methyltransferase [Roseiflexaceae bacterium]